MSETQWIGLVSLLGALVLIGGGVVRRRTSRASMWRNVAIWGAVFALLFVGSLWLEGRA